MLFFDEDLEEVEYDKSRERERTGSDASACEEIEECRRLPKGRPSLVLTNWRDLSRSLY